MGDRNSGFYIVMPVRYAQENRSRTSMRSIINKGKPQKDDERQREAHPFVYNLQRRNVIMSQHHNCERPAPVCYNITSFML